MEKSENKNPTWEEVLNIFGYTVSKKNGIIYILKKKETMKET